jgi:hypothetical protein
MHATVDPEQALEIAATLMTAATSNIHISPPGKSVGAGGTMLTVLALHQAWRRGRQAPLSFTGSRLAAE